VYRGAYRVFIGCLVVVICGLEVVRECLEVDKVVSV